ncbi:MAG: hypothetical protein ACI841_000776 [Planctomycetota bacterium]|jgi:hypothetical protein
MSPLTYQLLHIIGAFLYVAIVFTAFANPPEGSKKKIHMAMGITSLVVLVAGFGLAAKYGYGFPGWMILKLVCWFALSATAGIALRQPAKSGTMRIVAVVLIAVTVYAAYARPF